MAGGRFESRRRELMEDDSGQSRELIVLAEPWMNLQCFKNCVRSIAEVSSLCQICQIARRRQLGTRKSALSLPFLIGGHMLLWFFIAHEV